jgi:hypothetical protein
LHQFREARGPRSLIGSPQRIGERLQALQNIPRNLQSTSDEVAAVETAGNDRRTPLRRERLHDGVDGPAEVVSRSEWLAWIQEEGMFEPFDALDESQGLEHDREEVSLPALVTGLAG